MKSRTNQQPGPFTGEELKAVSNHLENDQIRLLFLLLRWTGIRPIDAIDLTWRQISFDQQQIEYVGKKDLRKRIRPIPAELLSALRAEYLRRNPGESEPVLQHANGKPFTGEYLCRSVVALGKRSDVPARPPIPPDICC
jgi:integrase